MPSYMTSAEHIEILLQGQEAWNRNRQENAAAEAPDLSGSQFAYANLDGFDLHGVVLQKAYLRGATLRGACLREADLQSAYMIGADLQMAQLSRSRLVAVNLNGANLAACAFDGADMREADCGGADLSGADFTDADLHGVNLLGANLDGAHFVRTKGLSSRQLMAAHNWERASFHPDLAGGLDLPSVRLEEDPASRSDPAARASQDPVSLDPRSLDPECLDPDCPGPDRLDPEPLEPEQLSSVELNTAELNTAARDDSVSTCGGRPRAQEIHKTMAAGRNGSRASPREAEDSAPSRRSRARSFDSAGR